MRYRITAIWDEELHEADIVRARTGLELDLRDSMDHMEFENLRVDVQELPRMPARDADEALMMRHEVIWPPGEEGGQTYPDDAPPHPWDQGLWIFPEDHPLASAERAARHRYDDTRLTNPEFAKGLKQGILEAGTPAIEGEVVDDD
jgi:hypothetical protein